MRQKAGLVILLGFRGSEDLGNGLKATFELEKRFNLFDGTQKGVEWDGAANMGLAGDWGRVRFGRVNELTTETIRKFDPFYQYGVGGMLESVDRSARISNTARYDSPKWSGFSFGASYSLGQENHIGTGGPGAAGNKGYAVNLSYDNGPLMATANWSRLADSNDSDVWNVGLAYKFGAVRVMALYENTNDEGSGRVVDAATSNVIKLDSDLVLLGLEWDIGPGQLDASAQWMDVDALGGSADIWKYAVGYTYNLSKRTSAYAQVSYTDYDDGLAGYQNASDRNNVTAIQIGMTHKF